jgi:hypothetical protein
MSRQARYFPSRIGDQIIWLRNFRNKIGTYTAALGYVAADITAIVADVDQVVYQLDTINDAAEQFRLSISARIRLILDGPENLPLSPMPVFNPPAGPAAVAPGALKRLFRFVKNLKTRPGFTEPIGEDLGVIGDEDSTERSGADIPEATAEARSGEVLLKFIKHGHMGVWIESQTAADTAWDYLLIDTTSPYNDTRPLRIPGQPEKRRYRLCYWDGTPTNNWSDIIEVTFGG